MKDRTDSALVAFCGSETRARTLGVLANATRPMSGYRVAKVAELPENKVYAELERALRAGIASKGKGGYRLADADLRDLLRKRVRLFSASDWDESRSAWPAETPRLLRQGLEAIRQRIKANPSYLRPKGWRAPAAAREWDREIRRPPSKDALLRRRGRRTSERRDWDR